MEVRVIEVNVDRLSAPWVGAESNDGRRVLFVREDATEADVAQGYAALRSSERLAS